MPLQRSDTFMSRRTLPCRHAKSMGKHYASMEFNKIHAVANIAQRDPSPGGSTYKSKQSVALYDPVPWLITILPSTVLHLSLLAVDAVHIKVKKTAVSH